MSFELTPTPPTHTGWAQLSECQRYRYQLGRVWDPAGPLVVFLMLNPSTADALVDDPTIRRCIAFAKAWGAGRLVVRNLYALRATDPAELLTHPDPVGSENDQHLVRDLGSVSTSHIVAAWGAHPMAKRRAGQVEYLLYNQGLRVECLGTTRDGSPRHPLYVAGRMPLQPYSLTG